MPVDALLFASFSGVAVADVDAETDVCWALVTRVTAVNAAIDNKIIFVFILFTGSGH